MNGISMDNNRASIRQNEETGGLLETMSVDDTNSQGADDSSVSSHNDESMLADRETRAVSWLRATVLTILSVATVCVSASVYCRSKHAQQAEFAAAFHDASVVVLDAFKAQPLEQLQALGVDFISHARYSQSTWPEVVLPDFADRAVAVSSAASLLILPVVEASGLSNWESFSVDQQGWLQDGKPKTESSTLQDTTAVLTASARRLQEDSGIADHVFDFEGAVSGRGPFLPLWETFPITSNLTHWVNMDLLAVKRIEPALKHAMNSQQAVMGRVLNFAPESEPEPVHLDLLLNAILGPHTDHYSEPASPLIFPLRDDSQNVVALLVAMQYWRHTMEHVLSPASQGVVAVIENKCGQAFTYYVRGGNATYMGKGDLHDKEFEGMQKTTQLDKIDSEYCAYSLSVYPSAQLKQHYVTHSPTVKTITCIFIFLAAIGIFVTYDFLVEHRQKVVMEHALQSTAIVSSLFPEAVRERLFNEDEGLGENTRHAARRRSSDGGGSFFSESPKNRIKTSMSDGSGGPTSGQGASKPIADLFPHCTVLFADIAGFTAWSSLRDPAQVFTLLESIYSAFDAIARKRGVFKVETIGDSYVAVTGLPEPQEDHAIIMARFARDCKIRMKEVTRQLELTLGPDTGDLDMRFGLHSGPVTAGVLRGERSRFQLFGDTVNTAARMESTGKRGFIQCSQATADVLTEAGKGHWVKPREEKVHAKGKGDLQTYWIEVTAGQQRRSSDDMSGDGSSQDGQSKIWGNEDEIPEVVTQRARHQRLIDYNVDLLAQHLKAVEARRRVLSMAGRRCSQGGHAPMIHKPSTETTDDGRTVLDEVAEVIRLPTFDARSFKGHVDPASIELDSRVMSQLKRYVTIIAAMYRSNPFHNFEHASHVLMSVTKLLQRVVEPHNAFKKKGKNTTELASELHNYTFGITSDPLTQFGILFSALIHDVDHYGISNNQLIKEGAPMAEKYKGKSVAEQNSVDLAWDLLMDPDEYPDLQKVIFQTDAEYQRFRQVVVNIVMATDIFDAELSELRKKRWEKAFDPEQSDEDDENRKATIVIEHIMQASDVAHTMQHWHVYQKWNRRLFDELYTAYKAGRMGVDPATFWYNGEIKFFDTYVIPLAKKLKECGVFGVSSEECLNYAINNRKEWESKGQMITTELVSNYNKREKEEAERLAKEKEAAAASGRGGKKRGSRFARRRSLFTAGG
uniref:Phosphodiesterase n=1 Tax=Amphora coffeiformis TaxID=265554 RepID=A0A7S3L1M8_9STRA|mmetsp:Transcript_4369/g.9007  ORF Transcript_4369/g.9007 Transcript_4369/m.9007 type:complete len:1195 (+) Transcript_4369:122-3706(+)